MSGESGISVRSVAAISTREGFDRRVLSYVITGLIFFGSATALPLLGPLRLSDLAFAFAAVVSIPTALRYSVGPDHPIRVLVRVFLLLIGSLIVSWTWQMMTAPPETIEAGLATGVQIPAAMVIALLIALFAARGDVILFCARLTSVACFGILFMLALFVLRLTPTFLEIDYSQTYRFSGLGANPNQLGLYLCALPFLSYLAARTQRKNVYLASFEIVAFVVINVFSVGKTLFIAWMFFLVPFVLWDLMQRGSLTRIAITAGSIVIGPFALIESWQVVADFYEGKGRGSLEGQGETRLSLWENGLRAWTDSPAIGHGPGPFSGYEVPYQGIEVHNTLLDWAVSFGALGFGLLLTMYIFAFRTALKGRNLLILAMFLAVATQSFTQFYGRTPYYWLWWSLGLSIIAGGYRLGIGNGNAR